MRPHYVALGACLLAIGCKDGATSSYRPTPDSEAKQIFPSLTLQGVRSKAAMETTATPETISTSEYYDPTGARYDLLHVTGIFMWCPHCNNETQDLASIAAWQAQHRVAALQIAMEGYGSASPTWTEVQKWVGDHNLGFPVLVDGQGAELGKSFPVSSVPLNIAVNPRTMEVLDVQIGEVGSCQSYEQTLLNSL